MKDAATKPTNERTTARHNCAAAAVLAFASLLSATGCQAPFAAREGLTIYLDGAGRWGDGGDTVARGLYAAGYTGTVREFVWTTSYNPLIDQLNGAAAKHRAAELADLIERFLQEHPGQQVNIIALSAGTGVATWAVEQLSNDNAIHNLVLLGSSLSCDYDVSCALGNIAGRLYVYHSPHDVVLEKVRAIGTIDGRRNVDSAGAVGLKAAAHANKKVVNIPWTRQWLRHGWTGAHSDCTKADFVRTALAQHIVNASEAAPLPHPLPESVLVQRDEASANLVQ